MTNLKKKLQLSLSKIKSLTSFAHKKGLKDWNKFFTLQDFNEILKSNINFDFFKIPSAEFFQYGAGKQSSEN